MKYAYPVVLVPSPMTQTMVSPALIPPAAAPLAQLSTALPRGPSAVLMQVR